jgi:GNAT superfamily N-acetyltransferase
MVEHVFHACQVSNVTTVEIRTAGPDDDEAIAALLLEVDDARVVSAESIRHWTATRPERARSLELVAVDDRGVIGFGGASLNIWTSTPNDGQAFVAVTAAGRGAGVGSALGDRLLEHLRAHDVTTRTTFLRHTDEGERWAAARGFERAIAGPLIAVDPRNVPEPELPDGFRCVSLSELTPEDVYDVMCESALDEPTPVPNDSFALSEFVREWHDPVFDVESSTAVVEGSEVVAFAFMKSVGERGQHGFTGCARAYRGRGLATAAKRAALRAAAAQGITRVTTSNAEENAAMRAINRRLGFEAIGEHVIMSRDL